MHICVSKLAIIGSDDGFSPDWHKAIMWTIAEIFLIGPLPFKWSCYWNPYIFIHKNAFENVIWEMEAILPRPQWVKANYSLLPAFDLIWSWVVNCSIGDNPSYDDIAF